MKVLQRLSRRASAMTLRGASGRGSGLRGRNSRTTPRDRRSATARSWPPSPTREKPHSSRTPTPGIYQRGRQLVRVARDGGKKLRGLTRPPNSPVIIAVARPAPSGAARPRRELGQGREAPRLGGVEEGPDAASRLVRGDSALPRRVAVPLPRRDRRGAVPSTRRDHLLDPRL